MKLICGLGNPGLAYKDTRHNVGFRVVDALGASWGISLNKTKMQGLMGQGRVKGQKVILFKPLTYMNLSGNALWPAVDYYRVALEDVLVIYDDVDLTLGQLRLRAKGSAGTHNGMKSVVASLGTTAISRLKIGVGGAPQGWDLADYVLAKLKGEDLRAVDDAVERAQEAVGLWLSEGIEAAMNRYNRSS